MRRSRRLSEAVLVALLLLAGSCGDDAAQSSGDGGSDGAVIGDGGTCGNDSAEGTELCDGSDLRGLTCASATQGVMAGGTLACRADCTFDISGCFGEDDAGFEDDGGMGGTGG